MKLLLNTIKYTLQVHSYINTKESVCDHLLLKNRTDC